MDDQVDNEYTLHDLVAQGACYPLAMMAWHQLMPRRQPLTKAKLSNTMIHTSYVFESTDCGGDVKESALN